ncbi:phosphoglucosamine mutase [Gammaproteobacteria bacterium]|nr:phosphoglucosamine mutase [Gammaproteobacteria bacterium]
MKFGTDGFRGPSDTEITPDFCLRLGFHTGKVIKEKGYDSVIIGKDTRVSGYMLEAALEAGFISAGIDVKLAGPIPTPAVSFLTATYAGQFGVVISASHNLYYDNGIKFFNRYGRKISRDLEQEIEERLVNPNKPVNAKDLGKAFRIDSAAGRYVEYCKSTLKGNNSLQNKTILVDAANGANYKITPMLLRELGAKTININCDPDGFNINENSAVLNQELFAEYAKNYKFDYCVAVDGDGDRLVLSDNKGTIFTGDDILYTLASRNKMIGKDHSDTVVGTTMSNQGIVEALGKLGVSFVRTDVGDKYISRELVKHNLNIGAEPSGHVIQREFSESGDANIALIQTLAALQELDTNFAGIKKNIDYKPLSLKNFSVSDIEVIESEIFIESIEKLKQNHPEARISVRKSGTQPLIRAMVEAETEKDKDFILGEIESLIS